MADLVDIDSTVMSDSTRLANDGDRLNQAHRAASKPREEDLIDLPEPKEEGPVKVSHNGQGDHPPQKSPVNKGKMLWSEHISKLIGKAASPLASQQEPHSPNEEFLRKCLEGKIRDIDSFKIAIKAATAKLESAQRENVEIRRRNQAVVHANMNMQTLLQSMENEKQECALKMSQLEEEVKSLTLTSDQLRQMLVPVAEKQVLDADVVSKFSNLRHSILGFVRQTWTTALKADLDPSQLTENQRGFFDPSRPMSYERIRHVIFQGLYGYILQRQAYFLGGDFQDLEKHIKMAESEMYRYSAAGNRGQVIEWRNATFKATENFRDDGTRVSRMVCRKIWDFSLPLKVKGATAEENGKKKLKSLCDGAVELSLMMRQLKDDFKIDDLGAAVGHPISEWNEFAEDEVSVPAPKGTQPGTIAYVITGVLYKSPKENLERTLVLEKAEVAVYE